MRRHSFARTEVWEMVWCKILPLNPDWEFTVLPKTLLCYASGLRIPLLNSASKPALGKSIGFLRVVSRLILPTLLILPYDHEQE